MLVALTVQTVSPVSSVLPTPALILTSAPSQPMIVMQMQVVQIQRQDLPAPVTITIEETAKPAPTVTIRHIVVLIVMRALADKFVKPTQTVRLSVLSALEMAIVTAALNAFQTVASI